MALVTERLFGSHGKPLDDDTWKYVPHILFTFILILTPWHIYLSVNINGLETNISTLKSLIHSKNLEYLQNLKENDSQKNLNINYETTERLDISITKDTDNAFVSIEDILKESINASGLELFKSRIKRDDGRRQNGAANRNRHNRQQGNQENTCSVPKLLNAELSIYARSVEIESVEQLDRWGMMRGPPIAEAVRLDPDMHLMHDNHIRIQEQGLYLVYAQLTFGAARMAPRIGFVIERQVSSGRVHQIARCVDQEHGLDAHDSGSTPHAARNCFTSIAQFLNEDDQLSIKTLYPDQSIYPNRDMTFFGILKLSC